MASEYIVEKEVYRKIKTMNRKQISALLTDMYMRGMHAGETVELNLDELKSAIGSIKGIGSIRLEEIMRVISSYTINKK